jgi:hypothetical protein
MISLSIIYSRASEGTNKRRFTQVEARASGHRSWAHAIKTLDANATPLYSLLPLPIAPARELL